ncbi:hypothetical protein [Flavobacterium yafengii]|uniref:hypothetical protein n=1 Tax=Flavobacterium yafengii TaxID=3041253 RepID=UPI0024A80383|nr:hypothetical protein [Flavobacterium yafengii]MDI6046316.1 hypothetical protein [Flavobacterium yafengii]
MKKVLLIVLAIFTVACSKDEVVTPVNKIETDFVIKTSQSREKRSDNEFQIGWSEWEKYEVKITWNYVAKELTFAYSDGEIETIKNCVVDGQKITTTIEDIKGDGIDDWVQNPTVSVIDFSDENIIRAYTLFDSQHDTNGDGVLVVSRIKADVEITIKK